MALAGGARPVEGDFAVMRSFGRRRSGTPSPQGAGLSHRPGVGNPVTSPPGGEVGPEIGRKLSRVDHLPKPGVEGLGAVSEEFRAIG